MVKVYEEKGRSAIRVFIHNTDLQKWGLTNVDDHTIKQWIKKGQKEDELTQRLNQIEDKLDRFIKMMGAFSHQTYMNTHLLGIKETEPFQEKENFWIQKNNQSFKIRNTFFPEFKIPSREKDISDWLEKEQE